jgi:hypothetical protein
MPGKSRPNPPVLKVESLSDGRAVAAPMVDDFTGEAIVPVGAPMPKAMRSAQDILDAANRAKAAVAAQLLTSVGILKPKATSVAVPAGVRPQSPTRTLITLTKKEWRRI